MLLAEFVKDFGIKKYFRTTNNIKYSLLSNYIQLVLEGDWIGRLEIPKDFSQLYDISKYFAQLNTDTDSLRFGDVYIVLSASRYRYGVFLDDETVIEQPNHLDPQHKIMKYNVEENTAALKLRGYVVIWLRPLNEKNIFPPYMLGANSYVIPTIAAMKTIDLPEGMIVETNGYYSSNDGAGAKYEIVQGNHTDNGGTYHELDNGNFAKLIITEPINVKVFGAKGDGARDDTTSINNAIIAANSMGGGEINVPDGVYMIKSHIVGYQGPYPRPFHEDHGGIGMLDNTSLKLENGAVLKAISNGEKTYVIVRIYNKTNVTISGGKILGERSTHTGTTGEWGYGIAITSSDNVVVKDITIVDCWGDGINIQAGIDHSVSKNITVDNVIADNNRRQGMSIEGIDGIIVSNSIFSNTNGTAPSCGIDVEPYDDLHIIRNVTFRDCQFINNEGRGVAFVLGIHRNIIIDSCLFDGNKSTGANLRFYTGAQSFNYKITNNIFRNEVSGARSMLIAGGGNYIVSNNIMTQGVDFYPGLDGSRGTNSIFSGNLIKSISSLTFRDHALAVYETDGFIIENNRIDVGDASPAAAVIILDGVIDSVVKNNRIIGGSRGIQLTSASNESLITGNISDNNSVSFVETNAPNVTITNNKVYGACSVSGEGTIYVGLAATGIKVMNNEFHQGFRRTNTNGHGANYSKYVIAGALGAGGDLIAKSNSIVDDGSHTYQYYKTSSNTIVITTGYVGNGNDGIMKFPTAQKPTTPSNGIMYYDTTRNKLIVYNGTTWVDIT